MRKEIKETASSGSVGAGSIAAVHNRVGSKPKTRDLKSYIVNYYDGVGNKLRMFPVNVFKLDDKKVKVVSKVNESFNLDSVLAQLSSYENKNTTPENDVTTYGVEDDKGNLMKVTILNTEADDFESYISAYMSELKSFGEQGVDLEDISLAELLFKLKDMFDIRDVEFPNIPDDIVYNAEEASDSVESMDEFGDGEFDDDEFGDDEFGDDEFGDDEFGDDEFGDDGFSDDDSVEDFEEFDDSGSTESILAGIIDMLKSQAEAAKANSEAEAEKARAEQAEYTARAAEATLATKEELIAMDAEKTHQKENEKAAKRQADLATYRYNKSRGMADNPPAQFEGFDVHSLLMDAMLTEEDIITDPNLLRRNYMIELKNLQDALRNARSDEEKSAITKEMQALKRGQPIERQKAIARKERRDAETNASDTDDTLDDDVRRDPQLKNKMQSVIDQMFTTESISSDEYELLDEAAKRQFKRYGNKFVRKFRCYGGPKDGKMSSTASGCGMRKDPRKVRQGKRSARMKKGQRVRKTQLAKRKAPSKRLVRMNKILRGMKATEITK